WYLHLLNPASPVYNVVSAFEIRGPLAPAALRRALELLVRRHENLRSALLAADGEPFQACTPPQPVPLPLVDLCGLPARRRADEARRQIVALSLRPAD